MRKNLSLAKWRRGEPSIGAWLSLANTHTAELMANAGFDWLCVDLQHGLIDYGDLRHMLPAISTTETTPLVRVTINAPAEIMKVLDAGAMGVIVPLVNTAEEAAAAVSACRYPPVGTRSFGPARAALYGGRGYVAEANDEIACIVMIETEAGLRNLEAIVTTPGPPTSPTRSACRRAATPTTPSTWRRWPASWPPASGTACPPASTLAASTTPAAGWRWASTS